jgi:hypothetical protein
MTVSLDPSRSAVPRSADPRSADARTARSGRSGRSGMHSRRALAGLAAGGLVVGLGAGVVSAPAASAASGVSYCFKWADKQFADRPGSGKAYAELPVYLMARDRSGKVVKLRKMRTDAKGCGRFSDTPTARKLWVKAAYVQDSSTEQGGMHLGTGTVKVTRAISATSASMPPPTARKAAKR